MDQMQISKDQITQTTLKQVLHILNSSRETENEDLNQINMKQQMNKVMQVLLDVQNDINFHKVVEVIMQRGVSSYFIDSLQNNNT